jgi:hypothetical protein
VLGFTHVQADLLAEWACEQHNRLQTAIAELQTNELLTNLDEMEGQPSAKQAQQVMMQAMGLRRYYELCRNKPVARAVFRHSNVADELMLSLAIKAGEGIGVSGRTIQGRTDI